MDLNIYAFVGMIMLIGIVEKNAIMQIDFALEAERSGMTPEQAIYQGCLIRFRPIMMTTMAALLGAVPIALGYGAGGEARQPLGLVVVGGLLFSQLVTLYLTPVVLHLHGAGAGLAEARGAAFERLSQSSSASSSALSGPLAPLRLTSASRRSQRGTRPAISPQDACSVSGGTRRRFYGGRAGGGDRRVERPDEGRASAISGTPPPARIGRVEVRRRHRLPGAARSRRIFSGRDRRSARPEPCAYARRLPVRDEPSSDVQTGLRHVDNAPA